MSYAANGPRGAWYGQPDGTAVKEPHWSFFIPSGEEVSLLELGSGTGELSCHLAQRSGRVETLSFSEAQRQNVATRSRADGLGNVHPHLHRPGSPFEYEAGTFDALIVDRLLNYPAALGRNGNAARAVERFLAEAQRVLAPDGVLYLGAENRLYHLLGLSSVFGHLRKSTVRPDRSLEANLMALGNGPKTFRRTLGTYRRLLRSAGFGRVRAFAPLPDAVSPQVVVTLDGRESQRFLFLERVRRHSAKTRTAAALGRVAVATGLLPRVVPFYYLVASK